MTEDKYKISPINGRFCIMDAKSCRFIVSCYKKDSADAIVNILRRDDEKYQQKEQERINERLEAMKTLQNLTKQENPLQN